MQLPPRCEQFIRERQFIANVSCRTLEWYRDSLRWLPETEPTQLTQADLCAVVIRIRESGRSAAGVNCAGRAINAFLKWSGSPFKLPKLREESKLPSTLTDAQIQLLLRYKGNRRRLHLLVLLMLDTGCRISEALGLNVADVDMGNLLVRLDGKGRKQRLVPISFALRKAIYRYISENELRDTDLLLGTKTGTMLTRRNALRDVAQLCRELGFKVPARGLHCFRHTFAVFYLRRGGSVFHLQKVLGHSTLEMTRRYANLVTNDLQALHERVSLLSR